MMIPLKNEEQLREAIERAKNERKHLLVQFTDVARKYLVTNRRNKQTYEVTFLVNKNGRFGQCTCWAGQNERLCKHLAAAAGLNLCLAEQGLLDRQARQKESDQTT